MPRPRHPVDDTFFDNIDTEQKAYVLGLLCADGYRCKRDWRQLGIDLMQEDEEVLVQIKRAMSFGGNIRTATHGMLRMQWTSEQHVEQLQKIGVTCRKSLTLKPLDVHMTKELQKHFVRGYFDGDGGWVHCFEGNKDSSGYRRKLTVSVRGTPRFCEYLMGMIPVPSKYYFSVTGIVRIKTQEHVLSFGDWLYENATVFMKRKKDKFLAQRVALLREIEQRKILGNQSGSPAGITHRKQGQPVQRKRLNPRTP